VVVRLASSSSPSPSRSPAPPRLSVFSTVVRRKWVFWPPFLRLGFYSMVWGSSSLLLLRSALLLTRWSVGGFAFCFRFGYMFRRVCELVLFVAGELLPLWVSSFSFLCCCCCCFAFVTGSVDGWWVCFRLGLFWFVRISWLWFIVVEIGVSSLLMLERARCVEVACWR